jgi:RNA-directed DNA polymerase
MTATDAGAAPHDFPEVNEQDIARAEEEVRRLQARIVKAQEAGKFNKVKVLQRLLAHSYSARVLAVQRVSHNDGKKTAGVDGQT